MTDTEREERLARANRATARAKAILKPGDRLQVEYGCGRRIINVTMTGWDGCWICCRTYNDIHTNHVRKVNGRPVSFADQEYIRIGNAILRRFIPYPQTVDDGTVRCIRCGQIDEDDFHDAALCLGAIPSTQGE